MVTWNTIEMSQQQSKDALTKFFNKLAGQPESTLNLAQALVAHMRKNGWSYTTNAVPLKTALLNKRINCDSLCDLIVFLYAYNRRPTNVNATRVDVHNYQPVFLPQIKITRPGLKIDPNVQGQLRGVFFSGGHRVACLDGTCYDLITGNKGSAARMHQAYIQCTKVDDGPPVRYRFTHQGHERYLAQQPGSTGQGLRRYICPL
jgi:hypothetical protein